MSAPLPPGLRLFGGFLDYQAQARLLDGLRDVGKAAPPRRMVVRARDRRAA